MIKRVKKGFGSAFALIMASAIMMTPLTAYAAFTQESRIVGNGVRLRKTPYNGTILELMYEGERILIDNEVYDPDYPAWIYIKRLQTGTKGWMEWSFFEHK